MSIESITPCALGLQLQPPEDSGAALQPEDHAPCLLSLPSLVLALITSNLAISDVRNLASTATAAFQAILEFCPHVCHFKVTDDFTLAQCISRLEFSTGNRQPSRGRVQGHLLAGDSAATWSVHLPLHALALTCAEHYCNKPSPRLLVPADALRTVTKVKFDPARTPPGSPAPVLPKGMQALEEIDISNAVAVFGHCGMAVVPGTCLRTQGAQLSSGWLSEICTRLRILNVSGSTLQRVPGGLSALQELDTSYCKALTAEWLAASSRARVRLLNVAYSNLAAIPTSLPVLEELDVSKLELALEWMPASSCENVRVLRARESSLRVLPEMPALQEVDVTCCKQLADDWLPAGCRPRVKVIREGA